MVHKVSEEKGHKDLKFCKLVDFLFEVKFPEDLIDRKYLPKSTPFKTM